MRKLVYSVFISCIGILLIYVFHFNEHADTMLNKWNETNKQEMHTIDQQYLQEAVDGHKTTPAFARRPVSTFLIENLAKQFGIETGTSFIIVNFLFLFLCGILVFYFALSFSVSVLHATGAQVLFFLGFSILCSFFNTNYTYDEPVNYFFILLSFIAFFKQKHFLFFVFFLLGCISREATYLFIPSILLLTLKYFSSTNNFKKKVQYFSGFVLVLLFHLGILYFLYPDFFNGQTYSELDSRTTAFQFNFQNNAFGVESVLSCCLILFFPMFLLFKNYDRIGKIKSEREIFISFIIVVVINSFIVFFTAIARESRLFALPLLLVYPLLGKYFMYECRELFIFHFRRFTVLDSFFILLNLLILYKAYHYIFNGYQTTIHPKQYNYNCEYLFSIVVICVFLNLKDLLMVPENSSEVKI